MINAYEAYKLSKQVSINEKVLKKIEKEIRLACKNGDFEVRHAWWDEDDMACNHGAIKEALVAEHYWVIDSYYKTEHGIEVDGICIQWRMNEDDR